MSLAPLSAAPQPEPSSSSAPGALVRADVGRGHPDHRGSIAEPDKGALHGSSTSDHLIDDLAAVANVPAVPKILDVVCRVTGMRFAAVARVTEHRWLACAVRDLVNFGLVPGGELDVCTTICDEIRVSGQLVVFDHASEHEFFSTHPTPKLYGFESYISVPINRSDGSFFGTLCALDTLPVSVDRPEIISMFVLFADLIAAHLDGADRISELTAQRARLQASELRLGDQQAVMAQQLAELRDREERLRLAIDGGNLGMWDIDPRSGEAIWNDHHSAIQGYGTSDQPRSVDQWQRLVHPDDWERISAAIDDARNDGSLFAEEHRLHRADTHELRWMSLHGRFFYDDSGEPIRFTGVSVDITDRKVVEQAAQAQEEHERRVALTLQKALLPSTLRRHPSIDMEVRYRAADVLASVGGDDGPPAGCCRCISHPNPARSRRVPRRARRVRTWTGRHCLRDGNVPDRRHEPRNAELQPGRSSTPDRRRRRRTVWPPRQGAVRASLRRSGRAPSHCVHHPAAGCVGRSL